MQLSPAQTILLFFLSAIVIGVIFLSLPFSSPAISNVKLIDVIFTAASAVCVTGLTVVNIGVDYSFFGQLVILVLIQLGGLGYMTIGSLFLMFVGKMSLKNKLIIKETTDLLSFENIGHFLKQVVKLTLAIECFGAVVLTMCFMPYFTFWKALYYGIFHSVSAFCNAGFSLLPDSFVRFSQNGIVIIIMSLLIMSGGIGYLVITEVFRNKIFKWHNFNLHARVVLTVTLVLILTGTAAVFLLEKGNVQTLAPLGLKYKILNSFFQAITPRTAGFNTLHTSSLLPGTLIIVMILMFIGASPGGTGGGIKTTTFYVLIRTFISTLSDKSEINISGRKIHNNTIRRSITIFFGGVSAVFLVSFLLIISQGHDVVSTVFETVSAFGTVGLSRGMTPHLNVMGKLMIIITMLVGRIGPLTIGAAIMYREEKLELKYPEEKIMVG